MNNSPSLMWLFFSFRGRIARQSFFLGVLFLFLPQIFLVLQIAGSVEDSVEMVFWALFWMASMAITIWPILALFTKRLHDLSLTGGLSILAFIPSVNWIAFLVLACLPSKQEINQYGPPPFSKPKNSEDV